MASGCLGLISFPREPGRVTLERIEGLYPRLLPALRDHPGIGFVLVRSERSGATALSKNGIRFLDDDRVEGEDPLAGFGPHAAEHLRRTDGFPHCADLMLNSTFWPRVRRGRRLRGAGRLARRHGRDPELPLRAPPERAGLAGGRRRRCGKRPPDIPRLAGAAGALRLRERSRLAGLQYSRLHLRRELAHPGGELARR